MAPNRPRQDERLHGKKGRRSSRSTYQDEEEVHDDELDFSDTSDKSRQSNSSTYTTSKIDEVGGVPFHIQKQLLVDIQAAGGLHVAALKQLCDLKPEIYGLPASQFRRKIQNKVGVWKQKTPHHFHKIATQLLGQENENQRTLPPATPPKRPKPKQTPSSQSESDIMDSGMTPNRLSRSRSSKKTAPRDIFESMDEGDYG